MQDGRWHHVDSYAPERAGRKDTVELWQKVETIEDPKWTELYHAQDPDKKAFGGKVIITMKDGSTIEDELERANAHSAGARPFQRKQYIQKFDTLVEGILEDTERNRFIGLCENLRDLDVSDLLQLNPQMLPEQLEANAPDEKGIF